MSRVVFLPLDERPCNVQFPKQIAELTDLDVVFPAPSLLGQKKMPADNEQLVHWLSKEAANADHLVVSLDMLVYGGIVPSRLHHLLKEDCERRLHVLKRLKENNPGLKISAFNLIMRVPAYNSSDEEPDYYEYHGRNIFRYGWLYDKKDREPLNEEEVKEWDSLQSDIPQDVLADFIGRRGTNSYVNQMAVQLTKEGIIDFLIIPLDDNSKYGFSAIEQRKLLFQVEEDNLMDKVYIYPGADEIGCTLLARVFCSIKHYTPEVYVRYSSTHGPFIIPKYEDRSLGESVKSHLSAAGAFIADHSGDANFVRMVNSPPVSQSDVAETTQSFSERHRAYFSEVHIREFVQAIRVYAGKGKMVALADVATCNGGDHSLLKLLSTTGLLPQIASYAGWNTSGNTMGTVVAHAIVESYYRTQGIFDTDSRKLKSRQFYVYRLIEDWGYQVLVRKDVANNHLAALGGSYFDISHIRDEIHELVRQKLQSFIDTYLHDLSPETIRLSNVHLPWQRMFEVGFDVHLKELSYN